MQQMQQFSKKAHHNHLLFLPLGGAGEIGMNLSLYHYQGKWLIVDIGIGFTDSRFPGADIMIPDISFLRENIKNIVGIIVTHAHEDHLGGIPYLSDELNIPIYATPFSAAILKVKFKEMGNNSGLIKVVPINERFDIDVFNIEMIGMTHSVPEMHGICIRTEAGNLFHTGDWKLDKKPMIGEITDEKRLKAIGDEGILAMIGDSTNIFSPGCSGSEGELSVSLLKIIKNIKSGMIVVTTFASNIARIHSIAKAAESCGKTVVLAGKSLTRAYNAALDCGYLQDLKPFLSERDTKGISRDKMLLICTGCQGEPLAATNKLAHNQHRNLNLKAGDTIIFSSKIIPGNEKKIFALLNQFCRIGVKVMTELEHFVHVSGHPSRDEVAKMYKLIRPQIAVPVHGEAMHIAEHADFALKNGAKYSIQIENGEIINFEGNRPKKVGKVKVGSVIVDGYFLIHEDSEIFKMRRDMRDNGLAVATFIMDKDGVFVIDPIVIAPGILEEDDELLVKLTDQLKSLDGKRGRAFQEDARHKMKKFFKSEIGKEPKVLIQVKKL